MLKSCDVRRSPLFDHPVGDRQHVRRDCETERSGGLEVDGELEHRRELDGQLGRFAPLRMRSTYPAARLNVSAKSGVLAATAGLTKLLPGSGSGKQGD